MTDLDTLRPEVQRADSFLDLMACTVDEEAAVKTIRAELRRLAARNAELEAKATRDHEWISDLLTENKEAEAELAALKNENAQLRDVLADRDMDREMAAHAHKELAALKARAQWQPIEMAPKDVDIVLAGEYLSGAWDVRVGRYLANRWPHIGCHQPTHWKPLPKPPAERVEGA